ncbi:MmgE/PrpD family protein [Octadecabacter sp. G9-8]|uniref:MmgE/PrpD family protein n=1 Tax=Octadecabacter dasysiphoniae TaxID=2909341 RepID=A0ABS9CX24_9RHOB|nr:MmgE/PrpD family protein [Octadecabacter dasysiphoniae]MCF2870721.1 MmgE/PrpD family protein [Octadecabacter dasysiphoniae]
MTIAAHLAEFACGPAPRDADALAIMRLSLYDWMACGIAGIDEPVSQIMRAQVGAGSEPVFGGNAPSAAMAAWINGATSHALDYDDTHFAHIGHPSVAVFPAAVALPANGQTMIEAAQIGSEVSVRVGLWLGRGHYEVGFHQTATAGAFGATAAAGRLLGLDAGQMQAAFGIASTQAAGLKSQFGTMGKPYHAGLAARTGVEAAQLALAGFDTRGAGLDGPQGFGATHHGAGDLTAFDGMGQHWYMTQVSHKFHACCHGLHAMLEAVGQYDGPMPDAVTIQTHPRWLNVCNIAVPQTGLEMKFSYAHTAALVLHGRDTAALGVYSDANAHDADLVALAQKVRVVGNDTLSETEAIVDISSPAGTTTLHHDLTASLPFEDRSQKLRRKGRALIGQDEQLLWDATHTKRAPNMDALLDLMQR